ncbi:DNA-binding transcriptional regulator YhcF (GntR family) [Psychromicrobium silvestre]|uniref:DNA-binding transcriptional regulator YhcF (GntR family) n=1 Tax=Psychromicrobium silvestre TaxID=1645614 RepID=A0A7Y9LRB2_9MICC|nr:GntR family transcriptional regulator [Psychromicrobium silvestre]NYE94155.1 DNA-binding transcriptional regulator YhcF (GntR family) [Psychromicrobium silvestre]
MKTTMETLEQWRPKADSTVPPFEQLRLRIIELIDLGGLAVGAKLPTVRALAASSGLAANTVARAIRELEIAGVLSTQGRKGTVVAAAGDKGKARVAEAAEAFAAVAHQQGMSLGEALKIVSAALNQ